jgi:hypothetical protein
MKSILMLLVACAVSVASVAQNDPKIINDANAQPRSINGSFHAIHIEDGIDLYLTQGSEDAVAVSAASEEYRKKIVTKVVDGILKVYYDEEWNLTWRSRKLRAYISVKSIDGLRASGGSDVIVKGTLSSSKLSFNLSGGSDFVGDIKADELKVDISGGSDMNVTGTATNLRIGASGGSDFKGYKLAAEYAIVEVSCGSDAEVSVSKELFAEASGGSDVDYRGTPTIKRSSASGGSSVTKRG